MYIQTCNVKGSVNINLSTFDSIKDFYFILNDFFTLDCPISEGKLFQEFVAVYMNPFY